MRTGRGNRWLSIGGVNLPQEKVEAGGRGLLLDQLQGLVEGKSLERRSAHLTWRGHHGQAQHYVIIRSLDDFNSVILAEREIASDRPAACFLELFHDLSSALGTLLKVLPPAFEQIY